MNSINYQCSKNKVFVYNLPYKLSKEDIAEYFSSRAGDIIKITFLSNKSQFGNNSGKCFINFKDNLSASNALKLNGQCILGQPIYVDQRFLQANRSESSSENYIIPRRRFQTIRQQQLNNKSDFDEVNGRFKGGYLLSDDFHEYCIRSRRSKQMVNEVKPVFLNRLSSLFRPSSTLQ